MCVICTLSPFFQINIIIGCLNVSICEYNNTLLYIVNGIFHWSVYNGKGHRLYVEMAIKHNSICWIFFHCHVQKKEWLVGFFYLENLL
jgi:hypothetical protein